MRVMTAPITKFWLHYGQMLSAVNSQNIEDILKALFGYIWLLILLLVEQGAKLKKQSSWPRKQWLLGHRGARAQAPENTITSFKKAIEYGSCGVEFDVILSSDGVPMVIHDDTLDRTTNGHGLVWHHTAEELSQLDATKLFFGSKKEGVPTLQETLSILPDGAIANIELKSEGCHSKSTLVDQVKREADLHAHRLIIIFSSFDGEILSLLRACAPTALISLLLASNDRHWPSSLKYFHQIRPDGLHLPPKLATKAVTYLARGAGLKIAIWTVNDPRLAKVYLRQGIDGIFTDHVPEIIKYAFNCGHR